MLAFLRRPQKFVQSSWFALSKRANYEEDCPNFCGLLKKADVVYERPLSNTDVPKSSLVELHPHVIQEFFQCL